MPLILSSWLLFPLLAVVFFPIGRPLHNRHFRLPPRQSLQNTIRVLDRVNVAIVVFDHLDRRAHLFCEEIYVHAFRQAEGGVGVAEAVGAAAAAGGAHQQFGFDQEFLDQGIVERAGTFAFFVGEDEIIRLRRLADLAHPVEIGGDVAGRDEVTVLAFSGWLSCI